MRWSIYGHESKSGKTSFLETVCVSVLEGRLGGALGVDGGWLPLPHVRNDIVTPRHLLLVLVLSTHFSSPVDCPVISPFAGVNRRRRGFDDRGAGRRERRLSTAAVTHASAIGIARKVRKALANAFFLRRRTRLSAYFVFITDMERVEMTLAPDGIRLIGG